MEISDSLSSKVDFQLPVSNFLHNPQFKTLTFVPTESKEGAHYLCAVLNSGIPEFAIKKYSMIGGKSFASAHILEHIKLPEYEPENETQNKLVLFEIA